MAQDDHSGLRDEMQELQNEAAALTERAKKTARQAEVLSEPIKQLQTQIAKQSWGRSPRPRTISACFRPRTFRPRTVLAGSV
jgi:septal ring factor EnvC (AmiA/AmiB activator)